MRICGINILGWGPGTGPHDSGCFPPGHPSLIFLLCLSPLHHWKPPAQRSLPQGTRVKTRPATPYSQYPALPYSASSCSPGRGHFWELCFVSKQRTTGSLVHCKVWYRWGNASRQRCSATLNSLGCRVGGTDKLLSTLTLVTSLHLQKVEYKLFHNSLYCSSHQSIAAVPEPTENYRTRTSTLTLQSPVMPAIYTDLKWWPTTTFSINPARDQLMRSSPPASVPYNRGRLCALGR